MISAWSIVRLVTVVIFFTWRMDAWAATRGTFDGVMALVWAFIALALAYRIWALGRQWGI